MKKNIIYSIFTLLLIFIFNFNVYAEDTKAPVTIDLDDNSYFNIFYELNHTTKLAQELAVHGQNFKSYLLDLYVDTEHNTDYSNYAIWLDYCNNEVQNCFYKIDLNVHDTYDFIYSYYFDFEMNFLSVDCVEFNYFSSMYFDVPDSTRIFFQYYEGNLKYYMHNDSNYRYYLKRVRTSEKTFNIEDDDTKWYEKLWNGIFKSYYDFDSQEIKLEWYKTNIIISTTDSLTPLHETVYNFQDLDMDPNYYSSVLVNNYSNGVILVPKITEYNSLTHDFLFYAYTESTDNYLKGGLLPFTNGNFDFSNIKYVLNSNFGKLKLNCFGFTSFKSDSLMSDSPITSNFYDFAYYFYTDDFVHDIKLFYNFNTYDLVIMGSGSTEVVNPLNDESMYINSSQSKMYINNILKETDIHSGTFESKYPTGIPTTYIDNGGNKNSYGSNVSFDSFTDTAKSSVVTIQSAFSGLSAMIQSMFSAFPFYSNLITWGLAVAFAIGVFKLFV